LHLPAPRLLEDNDDREEGGREKSEREREERTLDELRFVPGDYMCVAVLLPKNVNVVTGERERDITIKGSAAGAGGPPTNGWRTGASGGGARGDGGWGGSVAPISAGAPTGRGGGHWRGGSDIPLPISRGTGRGRGVGGDFAGRDRDYDSRMDSRGDRDRRVPPPRRDSPPHRGGGGRDRDRGGPRGGRRSPSRSRSRTPPRRKRYD
jgi:histone deacetylase complex subunit SAP18